MLLSISQKGVASKFLVQSFSKRSITASASVSNKITDMFIPKEARKDSQSNLLTKKEKNHLYKLQFHNVKPSALEAYKKLCADYMYRVTETDDLPVECVGSWSCWYGHQDTVVHLWRYNGGYKAIGEVNKKLSNYEWYRNMRADRSQMLRGRHNQLLMEFSFWDDVKPREGPNIYELRTYHLKPGTMIEWGNNWAKGVKSRQANNEAVGGFFSEIGDLNVVHHLWAYKDLQDRKETRGAAWSTPDWDNVVYYTVPLIRKMSSSIMIPLPHSPLQ